jgi:hypothetical protein
MVISQTDYQLAKHSLDDIKSGTASMHRIMATFLIGGSRQQWAAVVALFKETAESINRPVEMIGTIYIYEDKSATAIVNDIEDGGLVQ